MVDDVASALIAAIRGGQHPSQAQIQQALVNGDVDYRRETAKLLALELLRQGHGNQALALLELSWHLGDRDLGVLGYLAEAMAAAGRPHEALDRVREAAYAGFWRGDPAAVLRCLEIGYAMAHRCQLPPNDAILIDLLRRAAEPFVLPQRSPGAGQPLRVGYVFWGDTESHGSLPGVFLRLAEHHDRRRFQPVFFSEWSRQRFTSPQALRLIDSVRDLGADYVMNPTDREGHPWQRALGLATAIRGADIDVLVFQSQYPVFLATALLRPAPVVVSLDLGDPHAYGSQALDFCIVPIERWALEHRSHAALIHWSFPVAAVPDRPAMTRAELGIPDDALVLMTAGFPAKFAPGVRRIADYLGMVVRALERHPRLHWVLTGVTAEQLAYFAPLSRPEIRDRIKYLGLTDGLSHVFPLAELYLDTYPVSGGLTVFEAMRRSIATVTYRFYFDGLFDKTRAYSVVGDCVTDADLVIAEPALPQLEARLEQLIGDPHYRRQVASRGRLAMEPRADVARVTRECEHVFGGLAAERAAGLVATG